MSDNIHAFILRNVLIASLKWHCIETLQSGHSDTSNRFREHINIQLVLIAVLLTRNATGFALVVDTALGIATCLSAFCLFETF